MKLLIRHIPRSLLRFNILVAPFLCLLVSQLQGVWIESESDQLLFVDNLNFSSIQSVPDNGPLPGEWIIHLGQTNPQNFIQIAENETNFAGACSQSCRKIMFHRTRMGAPGERTDLIARFQELISGETFSVEFMAKLNLDSGARFWSSDTPGGWLHGQANFWAAPGSDKILYWPGAPVYADDKWAETGLRFRPNRWQHWRIEVDLLRRVYTLAVDAEKSREFPFVEEAQPVAGYFMMRVGVPTKPGGTHQFSIAPPKNINQRLQSFSSRYVVPQ